MKSLIHLRDATVEERWGYVRVKPGEIVSLAVSRVVLSTRN